MTVTRNQFFLLLFLSLIGISVVPKLIWLARSKRAMGTVEFIGHGNLGSVLGLTTYPVVSFLAGSDTIHFNGNYNRDVKPREVIGVRYQGLDPADARMNNFVSIWGDDLPFVILSLLICSALFFTPDIIPKKSTLRFGWWPLIRIQSPKDSAL